jgi:uncharacterized membrane-anchored protein
MSRIRIFAVTLAILLLPALAAANPAEPAPASDLLESLKLQTGSIDLAGGIAALDVPDTFRYIGPEDTRRFLEEGWGNPDGSGTLGMLLPTETDLFGGEGWGVVITYQEDGHVSDEDANEIDYKEMLQSMQEESREGNAEREKAGYQPVQLIGWAAPPRYDNQAKKLYWAKELKFGDDAENTLNYNVRILGRKGVLVMNAVSEMPQLSTVEERMQQVLAFTEFKQGHRYSDFDSGVDKVAGYGIATLIGGSIAAKAGLFAKLGALLLAFKKVILVGLVAVGAFIAKLFRRRKEAAATLETPQPPEAGA